MTQVCTIGQYSSTRGEEFEYSLSLRICNAVYSIHRYQALTWSLVSRTVVLLICT